ncbi:MAG: Uncharacterized protein AUREO_063250 [Aureobasidium pullulans]|nr:MAG: Uncharacterized protein AUREO_063250 [Aureobasidium pullulans]
MDLPIKSSISQIGETQWLIGHDHICELQDSSPLHDDILYHWRDPLGRTFQVRCTSSIPATIPIPIQPFYSAGTSAAVWEFAGLIWKVKSWVPDVEDEAQTIGFVKDTFPTIPVPEIICHWTEVSGKRSFMAMKRAPGETSDASWCDLSDSERKTVASDLADYTLLMADVRRDALESVSGLGVTDAFIQPDSWHLPTFRLEIDEAKGYFQPLNIDGGFVFTHGDLNPGNLLIDKGKITCILDWEFAGFFPKWWINYKARIHAMSLSNCEPSNAWIDAIRSELEIRGIVLDFERYNEWACKRK